MIVSGSANLSTQQFQASPRLQNPSSERLQTRQGQSASNQTQSERDQLEQSQAEQRELQQLRNRDREVRAHELAHIAVGGRYVTSGANFTYETGPDGRRYAVGGDVSIDTSEVPGDPEATLQKLLVVVRAALAPATPSAQDRRVAAQAITGIQQARVDIALQARVEQETPVGSQLDTFA